MIKNEKREYQEYVRDIRLKNQDYSENKKVSEYSKNAKILKNLNKKREWHFIAGAVYIMSMLVIMIISISSIGGGALVYIINIGTMAGIIYSGIAFSDDVNLMKKITIGMSVIVVLLALSGIMTSFIITLWVLIAIYSYLMINFAKTEVYLKGQYGYPYFSDNCKDKLRTKAYIPYHFTEDSKGSVMDDIYEDEQTDDFQFLKTSSNRVEMDNIEG